MWAATRYRKNGLLLIYTFLININLFSLITIRYDSVFCSSVKYSRIPHDDRRDHRKNKLIAAWGNLLTASNFVRELQCPSSIIPVPVSTRVSAGASSQPRVYSIGVDLKWVLLP